MPAAESFDGGERLLLVEQLCDECGRRDGVVERQRSQVVTSCRTNRQRDHRPTPHTPTRCAGRRLQPFAWPLQSVASLQPISVAITGSSTSGGGSSTYTCPLSTFTRNVRMRYSSPCSDSPVSSENVFLCSGQATFGSSPARADDAARQDERLLVRAHVLRGVPLAAAGEVEHGDLRLAVLDRRAAIEREIVRAADRHPPQRRLVVAARCSPSERPSSMRNCSSDTNSLGQSAGRLCPRSLTNSMHDSASSLLTNWRNRRRFSGSRTTAAHSHWYVSTSRCDHALPARRRCRACRGRRRRGYDRCRLRAFRSQTLVRVSRSAVMM